MLRQIDSGWRISNLDLVIRGAAGVNPQARENQTSARLSWERLHGMHPVCAPNIPHESVIYGA
jgi:hypothetical protein